MLDKQKLLNALLAWREQMLDDGEESAYTDITSLIDAIEDGTYDAD